LGERFGVVSRVAFKIEVRQKAAGKPVVYHVLCSLGQHAAMVERFALLQATATFKTSRPEEMRRL
jgi:hypothetical protein